MPTTLFQVKKARTVQMFYQSYTTTSGYSAGQIEWTRDAPQVTSHREKTWVRTPGFRALLESGGVLPQNGFIFTQWSIPASGGSFQTITSRSGLNWSNEKYTYTGPAGVGIHAPSPSLNFSELALQLIKKAKGSEWNVPIFFAEGRKTASLVVETAERLVLMGLALKQGRLRDFVRHAHPSSKTRLASNKLRKRFGKDYAKDPKKAFSSYWLQLQYGWVPFMSDVKNAVETLETMLDRPNSLDGRVTVSSSTTKSWTTTNVVIFSDSGMQVRGDIDFIEKTQKRAVWHFTVKPQDIPGRLGLLNPATVAYELVPFSFVADWFIPLGSYFSALDAPMRFSHRNGTYGERLETLMASNPMSVTGAASFSGFSGAGSYVYVQRVPMSTIPSASLLDLSFRADLGAKQVTSAVALLHQLFRK